MKLRQLSANASEKNVSTKTSKTMPVKKSVTKLKSRRGEKTLTGASGTKEMRYANGDEKNKRAGTATYKRDSVKKKRGGKVIVEKGTLTSSNGVRTSYKTKTKMARTKKSSAPKSKHRSVRYL